MSPSAYYACKSARRAGSPDTAQLPFALPGRHVVRWGKNRLPRFALAAWQIAWAARMLSQLACANRDRCVDAGGSSTGWQKELGTVRSMLISPSVSSPASRFVAAGLPREKMHVKPNFLASRSWSKAPHRETMRCSPAGCPQRKAFSRCGEGVAAPSEHIPLVVVGDGPSYSDASGLSSQAAMVRTSNCWGGWVRNKDIGPNKRRTLRCIPQPLVRAVRHGAAGSCGLWGSSHCGPHRRRSRARDRRSDGLALRSR